MLNESMPNGICQHRFLDGVPDNDNRRPSGHAGLV